jgi:hypothetical protein
MSLALRILTDLGYRSRRSLERRVVTRPPRSCREPLSFEQWRASPLGMQELIEAEATERIGADRWERTISGASGVSGVV